MNSQIKLKRNKVNKWYYEKGQGMLLTESTQKLYSNYKEALEKIEKNWDGMIGCERCSEKENVRGECGETACRERRCKYCEIIFLKNMTSGFRTNLLKDIGTREELKKSSSYAELYIKWKNQEIYKNSIYQQNLEFTIFYIGTQSIKLQNAVTFIIKNIDKNIPEFIERQIIPKLTPGERFTFVYNLTNFDNEWLKTGTYSLKVVADSVYTENMFYLSNTQDKIKVNFNY